MINFVVHQEHNNHDQEEDYLSCALYNDRNDDQGDDQDDQDGQDDDRAHLSCALDDDRAERLQRGKRVVSLQPGGEYYYKGDKGNEDITNTIGIIILKKRKR